MASLKEIEGIDAAYAEKLGRKGIKSVEDLLSACATAKSRGEVCAATGIAEDDILKWLNRADLSRVRGIGKEYSDLLEAAGVDTVPELSHRRADNLLAAMTKTNQEKSLVQRLPTEAQVANWIEQAKGLPRVIEY